MIDIGPFPFPTPDTRTAIIHAIQGWNSVLDDTPDQELEPSQAGPATTEPTSRARTEHDLRTAAERAPLVYPGPAGELIRRELQAAADFGYGPTSGQGLVSRLADQILAAGPTPDSSRRAPLRPIAGDTFTAVPPGRRRPGPVACDVRSHS